jgi:SAM-dependent methyltransferase
VIGVDLMSEGIAAARALARAEGLTGVSIVEADAYATELPRASFDLVHARFLAAPLGRPEALVREMIALCRPGGVVVLEEPDQASWGYVPTPRVWPRVKEVFEAVFPRFGGDANAGRSVYGLLRRQGLEDVHVDAAVVALQGGHPYMQTPVHGLAAMRRHIVDAALMTDREVDEAIDELGRAAGDPGVHSTTFMLVQTWGRRPAALSKPRAVQREVKNADHGP